MQYGPELSDDISKLEMLQSAIKPLRRKIRKEKFLFSVKNNKALIAKKFFGILIPVLFVIFCGFYVDKYANINVIHLTSHPNKNDTITINQNSKTHQAFLQHLAKLESNGDYTIVNQFGYMGKYQFGREALTAIGMPNLSKEDFLASPELQEVCMKMLMRKNKSILAPFIGKYQSRTIGGIYITESGILAAAHMAPQGVIEFLTSGGEKVFKDGNGTPITKYLKEFSGYQLEL